MVLTIKTSIIKLDQLLKHSNMVSSGGEAKMIISEGMVKVNGKITTQRGKKISPGDTVTYNNETVTVIREGSLGG